MKTPGKTLEAREGMPVLCRQCGGPAPEMVGRCVLMLRRLREELARVKAERDEATGEAFMANMRNRSQALEIERLRAKQRRKAG